MKKIQWTEQELDSARIHGGVCLAVAEDAIRRSGFTFADIESVNGHTEAHRAGSNAERRYRSRATNEAIRKVAEHPECY